MHLKLSLVSSSLVVMAIADVPGSGSEWSVGGQTYSSRAKAQTAACSLQMVCQRHYLNYLLSMAAANPAGEVQKLGQRLQKPRNLSESVLLMLYLTMGGLTADLIG